MFKYTIAFDLNGNDHGIETGLQAAYTFARQNPDFLLKLIGDFTKKSNLEQLPNIMYLNNPTVPSNPKDLRATLRENTSMNQAIQLIKEKSADAILSSGDSGSYISGLTLKLGRLANISRPAFMPVCSGTNGNKFLFLDVGANLEVKTQYLVEWAKLAKSFYQTMFGKTNPSIALLNIGTEDYKGNAVAIEANSILKQDTELNYVGFRETRELFRGYVDIAIIDGYGGNLVLKSYEGAIFTFKDLLKQHITSNIARKLAALVLKPAFKQATEVLDYRNVGCAWVFGVNALAIKAHGSSDAKSYLAALNQIKHALESNLLANLKERMDHEQ